MTVLTSPCAGHMSCKTKDPDAVLINLDTVLVKVAPWCPGFPLAHVSTLGSLFSVDFRQTYPFSATGLIL